MKTDYNSVHNNISCKTEEIRHSVKKRALHAEIIENKYQHVTAPLQLFTNAAR